MYYKNSFGVLRSMLWYFSLMVLGFVFALTHFFNHPVYQGLVLVLMILGSGFLLWHTIYQWSRPAITVVNEVVYYSNGFYRKRIGTQKGTKVGPSIYGPLFSCISGEDSSINVFRSDYNLGSLSQE